MSWLKRVFGGETERTRGDSTLKKGTKAGKPSKRQGCGHASIEEGLNAGCVECALLFKKLYQ